MGTQYRRVQDKRTPAEKEQEEARRADARKAAREQDGNGRRKDGAGDEVDDLGFPPGDESRFG